MFSLTFELSLKNPSDLLQMRQATTELIKCAPVQVTEYLNEFYPNHLQVTVLYITIPL
jgi:hypothetical protein